KPEVEGADDAHKEEGAGEERRGFTPDPGVRGDRALRREGLHGGCGLGPGGHAHTGVTRALNFCCTPSMGGRGRAGGEESPPAACDRPGSYDPAAAWFVRRAGDLRKR